MNNDFYIGYLPKVPDGLRRFLRIVIPALAVISVVIAVVLVYAQSPFPFANFEFNQVREFDGTISEYPYPTLYVSRTGSNTLSAYPLVGQGKHGAKALVAGYDSSTVHVKGKLIYRSEGTMIEVVPGTIQRKDPMTAVSLGSLALGPRVVLTGEIVDSKCFLGVMNPGRGKVHRDCAARCISGGVPPALLTRDTTGQASVLLIANQDGSAIDPRTILDKVAEPVRVSGRMATRNSQRLLLVERIDRI
jgi:hypothetical protein